MAHGFWIFFVLFLARAGDPPAATTVAPAATSQTHDNPDRAEAEGTVTAEVLRRLLKASVRLSVSSAEGVNLGSGVSVGTNPTGEDLYVVTCGHIARGTTLPKRVSVEFYREKDKPESAWGEIIDVDLGADVGLIRVPNMLPGVESVALARELIPVRRGENLTSIGCSLGEHPSALAVKLTAIDKYQGPQNFECTVSPEQGRSGGGLFNVKGQLVGVCIAADAPGKKGVYAGSEPLKEILKKNAPFLLKENP